VAKLSELHILYKSLLYSRPTDSTDPNLACRVQREYCKGFIADPKIFDVSDEKKCMAV